MAKTNIYIGIDPDINKSGVAFYERDTKKLEMSNLTFFQIFDYFKSIIPKGDFTVVIEAGWQNKSNWHKVKDGSAALNAQIGKFTGANHEVGKKLVEMCEYLEIKYELVRPTRAKMNAETFNKITGTIGRTNPEMRDAAMLVYGK